MAKPRHIKLVPADAEHIDMMLAGRGWQLYSARIAGERARKLDELEQPKPEAETSFLRGMLAGLKLALEIPAILKVEAKQEK